MLILKSGKQNQESDPLGCILVLPRARGRSKAPEVASELRISAFQLFINLHFSVPEPLRLGDFDLCVELASSPIASVQKPKAPQVATERDGLID